MYCNELVRCTCLRTHANCLCGPRYRAINSEIDGTYILNLQAVRDVFSDPFSC